MARWRCLEVIGFQVHAATAQRYKVKRSQQASSAVAAPRSGVPLRDGEAWARLFAVCQLAAEALGWQTLARDHPNFQLAQLAIGNWQLAT